jgi:trehalose/maltose hydrolase-like predicted phosphorylase
VRSGLDGRVANAGVKRYRDLAGRHLTVLRADEAGAETIQLQAETTQSHIRIALAARTRVLVDRVPVAADLRLVTEPGYVAHDLELAIDQGKPVAVEKVVALYTSRDRAISESLLAAAEAVRQAADFDELLARHALAWHSQWSRLDMTVDAADEWTMTALHLHVLHLLQTMSQNSVHLDVGVPARGWHGEAYRGHVFWDELFIFPFLDFQRPELARAMLDYRHARIDAARAAARESGHRGAMFPWQSGSDGREETQRIHLNPRSGRWLPDHTRLQRHVNIAIAYNVWQHFLVTGSVRFLRTVGAELVLEIARYLSDIATYDAELDRYEILGVMGPDEYHDAYPDSDRPGLDNNTYTNVMTVWVLLRALEVLEVLPPHYRQEVVEELGIGDDEVHRWRDITGKMRVVFHRDGVLTQFEGYEQLPEFDWQGYRAKYGDIQRLDRLLEAEGDTANRYKVSKQADTLMLLFLLSRDELRDLLRNLGYEVSTDQITRTVRYYLDRTSHGSTLSGVVTAWVLARYDPEQAWPFVLDALESDIADVQGGTTAEGIHLGAMAGTIDILQRGLSGMRPRGEVLRFDPALPTAVKRLGFSVHYRDHRIDVDVTHDSLRVGSRPGTGWPITILVRATEAELRPGGQVEFDL